MLGLIVGGVIGILGASASAGIAIGIQAAFGG